MDQRTYYQAENFFNALPDASQATTCWENNEKEKPIAVKYLVLMNDQFDVIAKASKYIYLLLEQGKDVPVVILAGGYNPWLKESNIKLMMQFAVQLGIKNINLRTLQTDGSVGDAVKKIRQEYGLDQMTFVTSRFWYRTLADHLEHYRDGNRFYFYVGNDKLEDSLNWVNGNAAGGGLVLLHKIARYYAYVVLPDSRAEKLKNEIANRYYILSWYQKLYLHFSFWLYKSRIKSHQEAMVRYYRKTFRERNWAY